MNIQRKSKGFTIIEVVLVLAIAGLIFLMVFIALPALQRSQRDMQRKTDLSRAITAVTSYASNNRNALPDTTNNAAWSTFSNSYLRAGSVNGVGGDTFMDPSGSDYVFKTTGAPAASFDSANPYIFVTGGSTCNGEALITGQGARKVALRMKLEGGGIACVSN